MIGRILIKLIPRFYWWSTNSCNQLCNTTIWDRFIGLLHHLSHHHWPPTSPHPPHCPPSISPPPHVSSPLWIMDTKNNSIMSPKGTQTWFGSGAGRATDFYTLTSVYIAWLLHDPPGAEYMHSLMVGLVSVMEHAGEWSNCTTCLCVYHFSIFIVKYYCWGFFSDGSCGVDYPTWYNVKTSSSLSSWAQTSSTDSLSLRRLRKFEIMDAVNC